MLPCVKSSKDVAEAAAPPPLCATAALPLTAINERVEPLKLIIAQPPPPFVLPGLDRHISCALFVTTIVLSRRADATRSSTDELRGSSRAETVTVVRASAISTRL